MRRRLVYRGRRIIIGFLSKVDVSPGADWSPDESYGDRVQPHDDCHRHQYAEADCND